MAGTSFTMDTNALTNLVENMRERMEERQVFMQAVGEALVSSTITRFEKSMGPDGETWKPSRRGGQTLVDSAGLKSSITCEASLNQVIVGSNKEYAAIHQFGGVIKAKNKPYLKFRTPGGGYAQVKEVNIPARPFLGIDEEDKEEIKHMAEIYLAGDLK